MRPGIDFTTVDSRYPFLLVHRQSETEQYLREYTSAHYGVAPDWNTTCVDVQQDESGVTATLESNGVQEQVHCHYLVGCDGPNSRVRRAAGLEQDESDYKGTQLQNLDAFLNDFPDADDYVHYCAGTDHFVMIVKLPGGFYRMLLSDRGEAAAPNVTPEQGFMRLVEQALRRRHARRRRLALEVAELRAARAHVPQRPRVPRRRFRAHPLDDGRAGPELLHAGRVQLGLEARVRRQEVGRTRRCSTRTRRSAGRSPSR